MGTQESSQVLLVDGQVVVVFRDPFSPSLMIDSAPNKSNNLELLLNPNKKL